MSLNDLLSVVLSPCPSIGVKQSSHINKRRSLTPACKNLHAPLRKRQICFVHQINPPTRVGNKLILHLRRSK
jgi:hypothetical protein